MYTVVWAKYKGATTQSLTKKGRGQPSWRLHVDDWIHIFGMCIFVYCVSVSNSDQPCKWRWRHSHYIYERDSATMLLCYDVMALLKHWRSQHRRRGGRRTAKGWMTGTITSTSTSTSRPINSPGPSPLGAGITRMSKPPLARVGLAWISPAVA